MTRVKLTWKDLSLDIESISFRDYLSCFFFCTLFCLSSNTFGQIRPQQKAEPFKDFYEAKSFLKSQTSSNLFSGVVLVQAKDKIIIKEAYGTADKKANKRNQVDTKFNIGSINKVFTSVCVMQLVEAGKIKLEDKIVKYIPELKMPMADEITILHLLAMQSGLGSYWDSPTFQKNLHKLMDLEDYLPIISEYELNAQPGTSRQYSNSGYELLGILVQRVSGENYYDYVKENVYNKAGMQNTDAFERNKATPNLAQGYTNYEVGETMSQEKEGDFNINNNGRHAIKGTAAGGAYSTLDDLYKFMMALQSNQLISAKSTDMVINRFRDFKERRSVFNFRGGSYGINAVVAYDADKEITIVVLSNYDPPTASTLANRLIATTP